MLCLRTIADAGSVPWAAATPIPAATFIDLTHSPDGRPDHASETYLHDTHSDIKVGPPYATYTYHGRTGNTVQDILWGMFCHRCQLLHTKPFPCAGCDSLRVAYLKQRVEIGGGDNMS